MTRPLSAPMQAQRAATASAPVNVVRLAFGAGVGDRFYSDRDLGTGDGLSALNARGRVVDWGRISLVLADEAVHAVGDCALELADADGQLRDLFRSTEFQRTPVTVYQQFAGLGESDLAPILAGAVDAPVQWSAERCTLRFDITDISTFHRATVGRLADRACFPLVAARDENSVLPLVFGRVRRCEAVQAQAGASAVLQRACRADDLRLYVDDASRFPQNTPLQVRIDQELLAGQFQGNTFHVTARGVTLAAGRTVTRAAGTLAVEDATLAGAENEYAGHFLRVTDPDGVTHHRPIAFYSASLHRLGYQPAIIFHNAVWTVPAGTSFDITTWARPHEAGATAYLVLDRYVYILNDAPSKRVVRLEAYGRIFDEQDLGAGQRNRLDIDGWVPLDPNDYTIDRNDTTSFPALGHAVTTATFRRNPKELHPRLRDDRLWAELDGVESAGDGTGACVENPAEVIRALLTRWLGLAPGEIESASFNAAASELAGLKMAFSLRQQADALQLGADLAFQGRCALLWEDGRARLRVLTNRVGTAAQTIGAAQLAEGSLRIGRTDIRHLASEVVARYAEGPEARTVVLRDAGVEAAFGRRVRALDLWAYGDRRAAASVARFWLARWKYLFEEVRLVTFLTSLDLQRADAVRLDLGAYFLPGQKGSVQEITHQPGRGEGAQIDRIALRLRLPVVAGCASTCETECESGGETGCLLACEAEAEAPCWQCETQCESLCELACTTEAELHCIVIDTGGRSGGGCKHCETGCESGCETACESACETACESLCETECETGCQTACESGCETECETGCETTCQAQCELACETGCETDCQLDCEATACETGCELSCQTDCELSCQLSCEATACETGCETACQASCETACQTGCEATCQTGCELACQTACETACQSACQSACQTGCQVTCETGCQVSCETGCQISCETGCQVSCETGCEVACETGCETGTQCVVSISDAFASDSGQWANVAGLYNAANSAVTFEIGGGQLRSYGALSTERSSGYLNGQALCSANHYAQIDRVSTTDISNTFIGTVVRAASPTSVENCAWGAFDDYGPGNAQTWLQKNVGGVRSCIANAWFYGTRPATVKVTANGDTATLYFDGVSVGSGSIAGLSGTYVGIAAVHQSTGSQVSEYYADNFYAATL